MKRRAVVLSSALPLFGAALLAPVASALVVSDPLGGEAIAVTYCPLCGTGMAFDARVGGKEPPSFGVSGLLYNSDVLLYDRCTESLPTPAIRGTTSVTPMPATTPCRG